MKIELSEKIVGKIKYYLKYIDANDTYNKFIAAIKNSKPTQPPRTNYVLPDMHKGFKTNTKLNHNQLRRDEYGKFLPQYRTVLSFKYHSPSSGIKTRKIELEEKDQYYIIGRDLKDGKKIKQFRKDRVVGKIAGIRERIY